MGLSGSGKTTLINIITGLDTPDSVDVFVAGQKVSKMSESLFAEWRCHNVGLVFQSYNLLPALTALENVALTLSLFRMTKKEQIERAKFALEVFRLSDRPVSTTLHGSREQHVAIARTIVTDPAFICGRCAYRQPGQKISRGSYGTF